MVDRAIAIALLALIVALATYSEVTSHLLAAHRHPCPSTTSLADTTEVRVVNIAFSQAPGLSALPRTTFASSGFGLPGGTLLIGSLPPDDPVAILGFETGDEILSINDANLMGRELVEPAFHLDILYRRRGRTARTVVLIHPPRQTQAATASHRPPSEAVPSSAAFPLH